MVSVLMIVGGLIALTFGADLLIKGAATLASRFGISAIVIGLTVVAFGTSSPELAVSIQGALGGQADITVGNVLGSNIFNIMFILGLSALIVPLSVHLQIIRIEVPIMVVAGVFTYFFALDGQINRIEGLVTFGLLIVYLLFQIQLSMKEKEAKSNQVNSKESQVSEKISSSPIWQDGVRIVLGLGLLVLGANYFVRGATDIARGFGVSELVIGLTIVAVGTSLPEVATSLMAALKKQTDIAVGNVIGSNIFNSLGVLGVSSLVSPKSVGVSPQAVTFDFPFVVAVSILCFPLFLRGLKIGRLEGAGLLGGYIAYVTFLILDQYGSPWVSGRQQFLVQSIFPMVAFLLIVYGARELISKMKKLKTK